MTKKEPTSYAMPCSISATDNDYIKLSELRVSAAQIPEFITALRALAGGQLNELHLNAARRKAVLSGRGGVTFQLLFEGGRGGYLMEADLAAIEEYLLDCWIGRIRAGTSVSRTLYGEDGQQVLLIIRVEANKN